LEWRYHPSTGHYQDSFIDPYQQYQEFEHTLDNTADSTRKVHVDTLHPASWSTMAFRPRTCPTRTTAGSICRCIIRHAVDPYQQYQETQLTLDNATATIYRFAFSNHEKTHIYRASRPANPDDEGRVDSELIDEFAVVDPMRNTRRAITS
jgi:hypothetical protein